MAEEIQEAVQIIRVAYDGIEIAMKVGSGGIAAMQKAIDFLKGIRYMYPMDFEEYLLACGEELLLEAIKTSFGSMVALPDAIHSKANDLYQK